MAAGEDTADPGCRSSAVSHLNREREKGEKDSKAKGVAGTLQDRLRKLESLSRINMTKLRICLALHFRRRN